MAHGQNAKGATGHTVTAVNGTQRVVVEIDGRTVAESTSPVLVYETGIPVRFYLPQRDVRMSLFDATDTSTTCPFKGEASYWTLRADDGRHPERPDVAWGYKTPLDSVAAIKDLLSFYDSVATISVEGEIPATPDS